MHYQTMTYCVQCGWDGNVHQYGSKGNDLCSRCFANELADEPRQDVYLFSQHQVTMTRDQRMPEENNES